MRHESGRWLHGVLSTLLLRFLTYLREVCPAYPGETHFPGLGDYGYTVTPELGKAVFWFNHRPSDGSSLYPHARHAGLKVLSGEKWTCTQWVTAGKYMPP